MKEYKFLKAARIIFKILSWIALGLGIVVGTIVLITGVGEPVLTTDAQIVEATPKAVGLVFMLMGAVYFLILYTVSEIIKILLDLKTCCNKQAV